jgi:hypothetical protein
LLQSGFENSPVAARICHPLPLLCLISDEQSSSFLSIGDQMLVLRRRKDLICWVLARGSALRQFEQNCSGALPTLEVFFLSLPKTGPIDLTN